MEQNKNKFTKWLLGFVDGKADSWFEYFILVAILINVVSLGLETIPNLAAYERVFFLIDQICLWIFIFELILKVIAYNKKFFKNKWNVFDLVIVLTSIISSVSYLTIFRVFKIFRSIRVIKALKSMRAIKVLKLVNGMEHLQVILKAIICAIPGIIWTCIILFIFYFFYAIVGSNLFSEEFPQYFGSLGKSLYTLFQLMLFDDFGNISRIVMEGHHWAWIYFASFALITAFVIMNVIVGIVVDSIESVRLKRMNGEKEIEEISLETLSQQISALQNKIDELQKEMNGK